MDSQLIGALDVAVFEAYCNALARVRQINEKIRKLDDITFDSKGGVKMVSFLLSSVSKQEAHLAKLAAELGLTPLSRTRLSPTKPVAKPVPVSVSTPMLKIAE